MSNEKQGSKCMVNSDIKPRRSELTKYHRRYEFGILARIKCAIGLGSGEEVCWFSQWFWDVHDYKKEKGGDGVPSHFHEYTCSMCGKKFTI